MECWRERRDEPGPGAPATSPSVPAALSLETQGRPPYRVFPAAGRPRVQLMSKLVPLSAHSPGPPAPTLPQPPAIRSRFAVSRGHTHPRVCSGSTRITPFSPGRPSAPGLCLRGPGSRPSWSPLCTHDTMFLKVPGNPPFFSGTDGPHHPS